MNEEITLVEKYVDGLIKMAVEYGPKIIGAIIVLALGFWIAKKISRLVENSLAKKDADPSLTPFLTGLTNVLLKILVIVSVMGMIGIEMTSFIAILGAAGLAIGMALSGTLQNFAGGVMILIFKPFKAGDYIEAQGYAGSVKEIGIFATVLNTPDKKRVILPNGPLSTSSMTNYSAEQQRRVDWTFGIAYGDDAEKFKEAINEFITEDERILKEPPSFIGLSELADSSVNFAVRAWVNSADYWGVFFDMNEKVYKRFGDYNLNIPFPQLDVNINENK